MKKLISFFILTAIFLVFFPSSVKADGGLGVSISKTVLNPQTNTYVKTLTINEAVYHPNDTVVFHISITNNSSQNLEQTIIKDNLPSYITFISGPGSYDSKNNVLSFLAYNLKPGTSQSFAILTKVVSSNQFPSDKPELCIINKAIMLFGQNQTSQNQAQFCIQNENQSSSQTTSTKNTQAVYPPPSVKTSPSTGSESILFPILLSLIGIGFLIIKRTKLLIV